MNLRAAIRCSLVHWILPVAVLLHAVSCGKDTDTGEVSLTYGTVESQAGSQFIKVSSNTCWTLSIDWLGAEQGWLEIEPSSGCGSKTNVLVKWSENDSDQSRMADIVADFGTFQSRLSVIQKGKREQDPGEPDPDPEDPEYPGLKSDALRSWMELPALESKSGFAWVFHNMQVGGKTMRNYSLYYDASNRVAHWVAYPLCSGIIGSGERTDKWAYDPKVPTVYQSYIMKGYGGGYDRGHQLPSADRLAYNANVQTFYATNMTPQKSELNQELWANLESRVRDWASHSDTLYVVTGCVPSESDFITDRAGNKVNVPKGYFKALLRYDMASTYGDYIGIGIYLEHREYSQKNIDASMVMSLDRLEEMLGIDFFCNLPDDIERSVEAQQPGKWWNINGI